MKAGVYAPEQVFPSGHQICSASVLRCQPILLHFREMKLHFALITKNRDVESMVDPGQRRNNVEGKRFNFRFLGGRETTCDYFSSLITNGRRRGVKLESNLEFLFFK